MWFTLHDRTQLISVCSCTHTSYSIVVDTLKTVDPDRKCFRMVGGVLVERTVKDVLPALEHNCKQVDSHTVLQSLYTICVKGFHLEIHSWWWGVWLSLGGWCITWKLETLVLQLSAVVDKLMEQLQQKGKELNEFREKHNIRVQEGRDSAKSRSDASNEKEVSQGVLVSWFLVLYVLCLYIPSLYGLCVCMYYCTGY